MLDLQLVAPVELVIIILKPILIHLRNSLKNIAIFFKHEQKFTAENILFPHERQKNPTHGDQNYKHWMNKNLKKRIAILKAV